MSVLKDQLLMPLLIWFLAFFSLSKLGKERVGPLQCFAYCTLWCVLLAWILDSCEGS
jgi:hypothetical protein